MAKLSFVQGRLSSEVAGRYQYFPIHNWKNEPVWTPKSIKKETKTWFKLLDNK